MRTRGKQGAAISFCVVSIDIRRNIRDVCAEVTEEIRTGEVLSQQDRDIFSQDTDSGNCFL